MTWTVAGLGRKVREDQLGSGLPPDLAEEFHRLSEWAGAVRARFGSRVQLRLVDVASVEGFFKSLVGRFKRYPAFTVDGERYVGSDLARVDALIARRLARAPAKGA